MKTKAEILADITSKLGFVPPFFAPAFEDTLVLENLWYQTETGYLGNPLPHLFKEKIATLLARYCPVPYCLYCHTSTLSPLGMTSEGILRLLLMPSPVAMDFKDLRITDDIHAVDAPEPDSPLEKIVLKCVVGLYLHLEAEQCHRILKRVLTPSSYHQLILFLAYNRTALTWAEGHPEISYADDKRVQDHLNRIISEEPEVMTFLNNYRKVIATPEGELIRRFDLEREELHKLIQEKGREIDEQRAIALHRSKLSDLDEMVGLFSHEINNPLAIIHSASFVLEENAGALPHEARKQIESIRQTVERMTKVIQDLRFFTRHQNDAHTEHPLTEIIDRTIDLCQRQLTKNECHLSVTMQMENIRLKCNSVSLSQALMSLIQNSIDAIAKSKIREISIECLQTKTHVEIKVRDSGKKLSPEIRKRIMTPYFTTKSAEKGTGLGLTIVKKIMEEHGGDFQLEDDQMTCFTMRIPVSL